MKSTTKSDFEKDVLSSKKIVLVDVWAPWCGPCRGMEPILEEVEKEVSSWAEIVQINVTTEMDLAQELGVSGLPTFLVFKDGKVVGSLSGGIPKSSLMNLLSKAQ